MKMLGGGDQLLTPPLSPSCIKQEIHDDDFDIHDDPDLLQFKHDFESDANMRQRLFEDLTLSFPGSALSRALRAMNDEELDSDTDPRNRHCLTELQLEKGRMEEEGGRHDDDDLTPLTWLQDADLLKNLASVCPSNVDDEVKENNGTYGQAHPPHVPYNPLKHITSKPPYSFSCLIFMAIEDSPIKKLPVKDIYNWILTHFPYFRNAPTGWKNSVRHNLSLNKCFKKVEKEKGQGLGKGSLWCIDPIFRPNLLQALRKTPYHPYHQLQMLSSPQPPAGLYTIHGVLPPNSSRPMPLAPKLSINTPSPDLFPYLSKCLDSVNDTSSSLLDSDIDVANTLMSLKRTAEQRRPANRNGARSRSPSPPEFGSKQEKELLKQKLSASRLAVCTPAPCDDHLYCYTQTINTKLSVGSPSSSIDAEYEFGNDPLEDDPEEFTGGHGSGFERSHSDMDCSDTSSTVEEGGSDGEQRPRTRGLVIKLPASLTRKRKPKPLEKEKPKKKKVPTATLR